MSTSKHRRTHNLLLINRLLSLRDHTSPFTLILDSLAQSSRPLVAEFVRHAKTQKTRTILLAFETLRPPPSIDTTIPCTTASPPAQLAQAIAKHTSPTTKTLLIIDSLHALSSTHPSSLPSFLSSLLTPTTSLLATYHTDLPLPLPLPTSTSTSTSTSYYAPEPLVILQYLATTLLTVSSLAHVLARKSATDRSLPSPLFGLDEDTEGVVTALGRNDRRGVVVEMEYRRKSGRSVREAFFVPAAASSSSTMTASGAKEARNAQQAGTGLRETEGVVEGTKPNGLKIASKAKAKLVGDSRAGGIMLLADHPLWRASESVAPKLGGREGEGGEGEGNRGGEEGMVATTFELGLTAKQRRDRDGVVLPYFDAQKGDGAGGRILYDMGTEDDFDDEEDEI